MILIQAHLRSVSVEDRVLFKDLDKANQGESVNCLPITLWAHVAKCIISGTDGNSTTPRYDHSHDAVDQGIDQLAGMQQLTQQFNFGASNSWDNCEDVGKKKYNVYKMVQNYLHIST